MAFSVVVYFYKIAFFLIYLPRLYSNHLYINKNKWYACFAVIFWLSLCHKEKSFTIAIVHIRCSFCSLKIAHTQWTTLSFSHFVFAFILRFTCLFWILAVGAIRKYIEVDLCWHEPIGIQQLLILFCYYFLIQMKRV